MDDEMADLVREYWRAMVDDDLKGCERIAKYALRLSQEARQDFYHRVNVRCGLYGTDAQLGLPLPSRLLPPESRS